MSVNLINTNCVCADENLIDVIFYSVSETPDGKTLQIPLAVIGQFSTVLTSHWMLNRQDVLHMS